MSITNLKRVGSVFIGSGAPTNTDAVVKYPLSFPVNSIYIDKDTGIVYVRKLHNGDTGDFNSNSGSGGSGGGTILQSPDSTLWQVGVTDSGALQTVQVTTGTPGTLRLFSPDNTEWNVTVNNSGALITTAI